MAGRVVLSDDKQHFKLKCGEMGQGRLSFIKRDLFVYRMLRRKNVPIQKGPSEGVVLVLMVAQYLPSPLGPDAGDVLAQHFSLHVAGGEGFTSQHNLAVVRFKEFYFKFPEKQQQHQEDEEAASVQGGGNNCFALLSLCFTPRWGCFFFFIF